MNEQNGTREKKVSKEREYGHRKENAKVEKRQVIRHAKEKANIPRHAQGNG